MNVDYDESDNAVTELMAVCLEGGVFEINTHQGIARQMADRGYEGISERQLWTLENRMIPLISEHLVSVDCPCCKKKMSLAEMWNVLCDMDGCDKCNYSRWVFDRAD